MDGARADLVEPLLPRRDSADFVIKARHAIFYMTPLKYLLGQKEIGPPPPRADRTGDGAVHLYSALDAYVHTSRSPFRATG